MTELTKILSDCAISAEISLTNAQLLQFELYAKQLLEWNEKMNLTAITAPCDIATKHFIDSLYGLAFIAPDSKVIDVGTGAGFPGVPLKIARPDIRLTLLDSLNKRLNFLNAVTDTLKLTAVQTVHARAEDGASKKGKLREQFDVATSRAVSQLNVLAEYCLPYVRLGGRFLAYKGGDIKDELGVAKNAIKTLGGEVEEIFSYTIPNTDIHHSIVVIKKNNCNTPPISEVARENFQATTLILKHTACAF